MEMVSGRNSWPPVVMVCEEPAVLSYFEQEFARRAFPMRLFSSPSGLVRTSIEDPGCVLIDLSRPEREAVPLIERIREKALDVPILLFTFRLTERMAEALELYRVEVVAKPFGAAPVIDRIEMFILARAIDKFRRSASVAAVGSSGRASV